MFSQTLSKEYEHHCPWNPCFSAFLGFHCIHCSGTSFISALPLGQNAWRFWNVVLSLYERSLLLTHDPGQQKAIYQRWNLNASLFSMTMPKKRESGNKNIAAAVFRQTSVGVFRARCYTNLKKKMLGPQELWSYLIWKQIWWGLISEGLEALKISLISVQTVCSSSIKELIPSRSLKSSSHGTELFLRRKFFNYVNLYWLRGKESFPEDVA